MKVGYLVNTYPRPSHSFIRREVQALARQGWTVHRMAMRSDRAALVDPADIAEDARTEHVLAQGALRLSGSAVKWMARRPLRALRALGLALACGGRANARLRHLVYWVEAAHVARRCWDLRLPHLHAHFGTNAATVAMLAQAMGGPSFSMTVHGPEEFDAPEALSLPEKMRRAAFAVGISSFGRSQLCRWADPADWPRIHVVPCGIEPWRFAEPAPMPDGGPHLVAVGRLAAQKGFGLLIAAVAEAAQDLPGLRLTLVGDGPLAPALRAQVARAGLGDRVRFAGWQDEAGVRAALAAAQALVLPSFAEGLPVVAMEAMAAGRPVIGTMIAGLPELVTPDVGWLVPAGDATALAAAMRTLAGTTPERRLAMGLAARARVMARHDIDAAAARLALLFAGKGGA
jgi:glycosyltransferase involved in cell wall biosynthesis